MTLEEWRDKLESAVIEGDPDEPGMKDPGPVPDIRF